MYDFCNWPLKQNSKIFVIGVANSIDLMEQQMNRNLSRSSEARSSKLVGIRSSFCVFFNSLRYRILLDFWCVRLQADAKHFNGSAARVCWTSC